MSEERTVFRGSPSLLTRFGGVFLGFLILAGAITFIFILRNQGQPQYWTIGLGVLAGLALIYIVSVIMLVKATSYEVTSERIRVRRGILSKRTDELELYRANDTSLIEPLSLRLFGLGTIEVRTMDPTTPVLHLEAIHGARNVREDLRRCIEECRDRKRVRLTEFDESSPEA